MKITVSELCLADQEQWKNMYYGYADFYNMPMQQEILDTVWSWIFNDKNKFYALIARGTDGEALGFMHYREMPSPIRGTFVGFLDDLYVKPEHRGNGVAEALFELLNELAKNKGWPFVRWMTAEDNYRGRGVYDKRAEKTHWLTYQMQVK